MLSQEWQVSSEAGGERIVRLGGVKDRLAGLEQPTAH